MKLANYGAYALKSLATYCTLISLFLLQMEVVMLVIVLVKMVTKKKLAPGPPGNLVSCHMIRRLPNQVKICVNVQGEILWRMRPALI